VQEQSAIRTVTREFTGEKPRTGHVNILSCVQTVKVSGTQKIADKIKYQMAVTGIIFFA